MALADVCGLNFKENASFPGPFGAQQCGMSVMQSSSDVPAFEIPNNFDVSIVNHVLDADFAHPAPSPPPVKPALSFADSATVCSATDTVTVLFIGLDTSQRQCLY